MKEAIWHAISSVETLRLLKTDARLGLHPDEVQKRQHLYGENELAQAKKRNVLYIIFQQAKSPMLVILACAAAISFWLSHQIDGWVIVAAIAANVCIGFFQEFKAERSLAALRRVVTFYALVIREGKRIQIPMNEVTVGDMVVLSVGAKVPADIRLIETQDLQINEAALTGESLPVKKTTEPLPSAVLLQEQTNKAFFGTLVTSGSALGVVVSVGKKTEIGKIAEMLSSIQEQPTPLQTKLQKFTKMLSIIILSVALVIFLVGIVLGHEISAMFTTAVALAVAAVPEGAVVVLTMILAIGMQRILSQKALVRKLIAAEVLGSTNVICTDKTGTVTLGDMHVVRVLTATQEVQVRTQPDAPQENVKDIFSVIQHARLCCEGFLENPIDPFTQWKIFGNPTDRAVVKAAAYMGIDQEKSAKQFPMTGKLPFSSDRKYMLTQHDVLNRHLLIFKGAPEVALAHATKIDVHGKPTELKKDHYSKLQRDYQRLSGEGLRIIAVGYKWSDTPYANLANHETLNQLTFEGFLCLQDPLRPDAAETVRIAKQAGIQTVMLTGDHRLTAQAIAKNLGLPNESENICDGAELERMTYEQLHTAITRVSVFARVSPKDKLRIIDAFQKRGSVVAMTGDGVNDAPALKRANIGIALGSGTDVAKETAEIVLLENNFSVILHAIEEGRVIFINIKKVILYLISDSFTEMILISLSLFLGLPLPLIASQILWVNLVSDILPSLALAVEPKESDVMLEKPVPRNSPIFTKGMRKAVIAVSIATSITALGVFYLIWKLTGDLERARSVVFFSVSVDSLLYAFSVRTLHKPIWRQSMFSNKWLLLTVAAGILLQMLAFYTPFFQSILQTKPLAALDWLIVCVFAFIGTTILEWVKGSFSHKQKAAKNI